MNLDIDVDFKSIIAGADFHTILLRLRESLASRYDARDWASSLRFITPCLDECGDSDSKIAAGRDNDDDTSDPCACSYHPTFENRSCHDTLRITNRDEFVDCRHYVAVSWVWQSDKPPQGAPGAPEKFLVKEDTTKRTCLVPQHVLSRAIAFADFYEVPFVWFDKECIDQVNASDQEIGVNSMDIVYERSLYPLGILQTIFETQGQIDILTQIVEGVSVDNSDMPLLLEVLKMIESDKWFTRAWIIQESVSGGFEMTLLFQHMPGLDKADYFGHIEGELELTISEFLDAIYFAYACASLCEEPLQPEFEKEFFATIDHILSYFPLMNSSPDRKSVERSSRQTCNAAQALTFLRPRQNHRVADRIAIMGNLCNYQYRLDTNQIEASEYGFSICAYALAIFNGDLSLTRADNPVPGEFIGFSWGPQCQMKLDTLRYFEDDTLVVRCTPCTLVKTGLEIRGWLWNNEERQQTVSTTEYADHDDASTIWQFLKSLIKTGHSKVAQTVWYFTRMYYFDDHGSMKFSQTTPRELGDVLDLRTAAYVYPASKYVPNEAAFRIFFSAASGAQSKNPRTIDYAQAQRHWKRKEWLLKLIRSGHVPVATLAIESPDHAKGSCSVTPATKIPTAIFDIPTPSSDDIRASNNNISSRSLAIFQFASVLDSPEVLKGSQRQNTPSFWVVEIAPDRDLETGHRILKGTGIMCHGYYRIPEGAQPETFIFQ